MIGWGVADYLAKVSIDAIGEIQSLVWGHVAGTVVLGALWLGGADSVLSPVSATGPTLLSGLTAAGLGVVQAIIYFLLYRGFGRGQISVLSPTFASFSGIVALVSIVFLGESARLTTTVALIVIFAGLLAISAAPGQGTGASWTPGFVEVLTATVLAAVWTLTWGYLIRDHQPITFALIMYAAMTLSLFAFAMHQRITFARLSRQSWLVVVGIGLGEALAYTALTWGYSSTKLVAIVAILSGAFSLPTLLLARVLLGERLTRLALLGVAAILVATAALPLAAA